MHQPRWLLLPLLKSTTHCLTVPRSTAWSPQIFSKHWWKSVCITFPAWRNSSTHLCLIIITSKSDTVLSDFPSPDICHKITKYKGRLVGRHNFNYHIINIHLWCCATTQHNKRHYFQSGPHIPCSNTLMYT